MRHILMRISHFFVKSFVIFLSILIHSRITYVLDDNSEQCFQKSTVLREGFEIKIRVKTGFSRILRKITSTISSRFFVVPLKDKILSA